MKTVVVGQRTMGDVPMVEGRDITWAQLTDGQSADAATCPCEPMDAEDLLYLLYTSGTTAKPKGIVHTTGGYLVGVATTHHYIFDLKAEDDVYWCAADIGWVTGHSYIVYGPLCNGATSILYEGTPDFPDRDRWWDIVERYGVDDPLHRADGHPRAHEVGAGARAEARPLLPAAARVGGRAHQPRGVDVVPRAHRLGDVPDRRHVVADGDGDDHDHAAARDHDDEAGLCDAAVPRRRRRRLRRRGRTRSDRAGAATSSCGGRGPRCCAASTATTSATSRRTGAAIRASTSPATGARVDEDGDFWLLGRVDDVMNVSGHRISTIEVESALVDHQAVAEAAVCGRNDQLTGQAIVAFVTLKGGDEGSVEMLDELRDHVAKVIGPIAKPANILFTPELPKTRSGKIMRRLLRDVAENRPLGDTTTLADPTVCEEIRERAKSAPDE